MNLGFGYVDLGFSLSFDMIITKYSAALALNVRSKDITGTKLCFMKSTKIFVK